MRKTGNHNISPKDTGPWGGKWRPAVLSGTLLLVLLTFGANAFAFTVTAQVDQTRITSQDYVSLQVIVDGGKADVDTSAIRGFQVTPAGTSSNRSYVNGSWSHKVVYQYMLMPLNQGVLTIPPLTCVRDGETATTREIKILVSDAGVGNGNDKGDLFAKASLSSDKIVPGQQAVYTIQLCTAKQIRGASFDPPDFKGLTAKPVTDWKKYTRTINGQTYLVNEISYLVQADATGAYEITPAVFIAQVLMQRSGRRDPFDSFFNDSLLSRFDTSASKPARVVSNSVSLNVAPLPEYKGSQPFSGLVGKFSITSALDKDTVNTGESVTLTITVQGTGNIMDAALPALNLDHDRFKVYEDTPVQDIDVTEKGFMGKKVFKQALVPSLPGKVTIPALKMVFFDIDSGTYKTTASSSLELNVLPKGPMTVVDATPGPSDTVALSDARPKKAEVKLKNRDILDIREDISGIHSVPSLSMLSFVLLLSLPAAGFGATSAVVRLRGREKTAREKYREKASGLLKKARGMTPEDPEFLPALSQALTAAVMAKGNKPGESLTREEARTILTDNGQDPDTIEQVTSLMDTLDAARFGGRPMDETKARSCLDKAAALIRLLMVVLCIGLSLYIGKGSSLAAQDSVASETGEPAKAVHDPSDKAVVFVDAVRAYKAGNYSEAAGMFEAIAATGVKNPDLFYNLGNAYLKNKDIGRAILWYERAKRLAPGDPDLKFNMTYAASLLKDKMETGFTLSDLLYFWQGLVSLQWLQYASITLSFGFFIWAGFQKVRARPVFSGFGMLLLILFACTTIASGLEAHRLNSDVKAVVVADKASVRSGTMENATQLFDLHAGTTIHVLEKKKGYIKIRFAKGKVGWVSSSQTKII